ncbi:MAG: cobalamin-dependent protein [Deltaproteobacteria bacterium]|jgi:methylmalonyl-CoA mutase C-terminal domain/subunit|nr:MAG: cobalamin-dependent protein [Deltaproteobacteria bacterium]
MAERKIRILLGKLGEGHKEALLNLAKSLGDAGLEVIYTELQDPEAIVESALQESVDHIGITTLPGVDIRAFEEIRRFLKDENSEHITITAGGFLEEKDVPKIKAMGVLEFFPKGTSFEELTEWAKKNIKHQTD